MAPAAATYRARGGRVARTEGTRRVLSHPRVVRVARRAALPRERRRRRRRSRGGESDSAAAERARRATSHARVRRFTSSPSTASAMAALSALLTPPPRASPDHPGASSKPGHSGRSALRSTFCASRRCIKISAAADTARACTRSHRGARRGPRGETRARLPRGLQFGFPLVRSRADAREPAPSPRAPRAPLAETRLGDAEQAVTGHVVVAGRARPLWVRCAPHGSGSTPSIARAPDERRRRPSRRRRGRRVRRHGAARSEERAIRMSPKVNKQAMCTQRFSFIRWRRAPCSAAC